MPRIESRKLQSPALRFAHLRFAHVLAVDVADARRDSARARPAGSAPPQRRVAGVEQQMHGRLGVRHEGVDVALRLDDRAHVVMIAELQPLVGEALGELGHLRAEAGPVALGQPRALGQRLRRGRRGSCSSVSATMTTSAPGALGHRDMRLRRLELLARRALEQFGRIPAADEDQAELGELGLQRGAVVRHLVALLHALDAGLPGLGEAGLERRVAADLLQIVVGPADRVGADANASSQSPTRWSVQRVLVVARARRRPPPARRPPAPRRPTRSRRRRSSRSDRCR